MVYPHFLVYVLAYLLIPSSFSSFVLIFSPCHHLPWTNIKSAGGSKAIQAAAASNGVNVRIVDDNTVGLSFGEAITRDDCVALLKVVKNLFYITYCHLFTPLTP